ncbi:ABC transporter permease [Sinosporangium siamense]|uniref:Exporter of polyketide antibiotics n=1 Tax=Sinosporangium siamense TaxID=1367973 RepID=A0A919RL97_9ACTN|nr:ABC transporter permease [Sinosporangium siamense]GII95890.1 exporter of polyketide antibiotics [Sinosporangium siamense]
MNGTGALVRLVLRRDRLIIPLWVVVIAVLPITQTSAIAELYTGEQELRRFAESFGANPALQSLYGPITHWNAAAMGTWRAGFTPVILALASLLTVIRHTRVEEETGRRELLGSAVLGRHAGLTAALVVTAGANLAAGVILALSFVSQGHPVAGALALGSGYAALGLVFAAVAAVAAQLTEGAGGARGFALSALGLAFLLRMAGDSTGTAWLSWLSPIAWGQRMRPFAGEVWWPLVLSCAVTVLLTAVAYVLADRRDVAGGLLPPRLGPAGAAAGLTSAFALAWRLHRGTLAAWCVGVGLFGAVTGAATKAATDTMAGNSQLMAIMVALGGTTDMSDVFLAGLVGIFGIGVAGYAVQAALRVRAEEVAQRGEPLLATAVSRVGWAASHLVFALLGPAVTLVVLGVCVGVAYGATVGDLFGHVPRLVGATLAQLPAVWTLAALAIALFGLAPRLVGVSWAALAVFLLFGQVGAVLDLPQPLLDLSPFSHLPKLPGGEVSALPLVVLTAVAAALTAAGLYGFRRRDVG